MRPVSPSASPIFSDLSGLPPLLIQASESEILWDDARRFVRKALAAGSDARLQSWEGMLHVWQIFQPDVPEANQAWEELDRWFQSIQSTSSPS
jgi:acetyl esterase/lipase